MNPEMESLLQGIDAGTTGLDALVSSLTKQGAYSQYELVIPSIRSTLLLAQASSRPEILPFVIRHLSETISPPRTNEHHLMYSNLERSLRTYLDQLHGAWTVEDFRETLLESILLMGNLGPKCRVNNTMNGAVFLRSRTLGISNLIKVCDCQDEAEVAIQLVQTLRSDHQFIDVVSFKPSLEWEAEAVDTVMSTVRESMQKKIPLEWAIAANNRIGSQ